MFIKPSRETATCAENIAQECIECKRCVNNCVMLNNYTTSPKQLFRQPMALKVPFSCFLCDHCKVVCPKSLDLKTAFLHYRQDGVAKMKTTVVDWHQRNSFSRWLTSSNIIKRRVFFPGCSLSGSRPDLVLGIHHLLKDDMDLWLNCCGNPTWSIGKTKNFNHQMDRLKAIIEEKNIEEIVVGCLNCYKVFHEQLDIRIKTIYEVLAEMSWTPISNPKIVSLHDPCPTRYESSIHDAVRILLHKMAIPVDEMDYNREKTKCCGSGAMVRTLNRDMAKEQMITRAEEAKYDIVTYCQECVEFLSQSGKETYHLLDVVLSGALISRPTVSTIKHWTNRVVLNVKTGHLK